MFKKSNRVANLILPAILFHKIFAPVVKKLYYSQFFKSSIFRDGDRHGRGDRYLK